MAAVSADPEVAGELDKVRDADLEALLADNPILTEDFVSLFCDPEELASHMGLGDCVGGNE